MRQINPSGKISLNPSGKSPLRFRPSHPMRGADRDRHERAVGCGGRGVATDERRAMRTVKTCGPDAPTLVSSSWEASYSADDGGKRDGGKTSARGHRGERVIIRKPLRRESRMPPLPEPVCSCAHSYGILHTRPRVQRASGFPCALFVWRVKSTQSSGASRRENARVMFVDTTSAVIGSREKQVIQYLRDGSGKIDRSRRTGDPALSRDG